MDTVKALAAAAALLAMAFSAQAQDSRAAEAPAARSVRFVLAFGLTTGGDKLATADVYGGDTENVRAGSGFDTKAGLEWRPISLLAFQGNLGYHDDRVYDWRSDVGFRRSTAELLGYAYLTPQFRLGAGIHKTYDAAFSSKVDGVRTNVDYRGKVAPVVEAEYFFSRMFSVKGRYVREHLNEKDTGRRIDSDHGGVYLGLYF
jgi:hypothetical protein